MTIDEAVLVICETPQATGHCIESLPSSSEEYLIDRLLARLSDRRDLAIKALKNTEGLWWPCLRLQAGDRRTLGEQLFIRVAARAVEAVGSLPPGPAHALRRTVLAMLFSLLERHCWDRLPLALAGFPRVWIDTWCAKLAAGEVYDMHEADLTHFSKIAHDDSFQSECDKISPGLREKTGLSVWPVNPMSGRRDFVFIQAKARLDYPTLTVQEEMLGLAVTLEIADPLSGGGSLWSAFASMSERQRAEFRRWFFHGGPPLALPQPGGYSLGNREAALLVSLKLEAFARRVENRVALAQIIAGLRSHRAGANRLSQQNKLVLLEMAEALDRLPAEKWIAVERKHLESVEAGLALLWAHREKWVGWQSGQSELQRLFTRLLQAAIGANENLVKAQLYCLQADLVCLRPNPTVTNLTRLFEFMAGKTPEPAEVDWGSGREFVRELTTRVFASGVKVTPDERAVLKEAAAALEQRGIDGAQPLHALQRYAFEVVRWSLTHDADAKFICHDKADLGHLAQSLLNGGGALFSPTDKFHGEVLAMIYDYRLNLQDSDYRKWPEDIAAHEPFWGPVLAYQHNRALKELGSDYAELDDIRLELVRRYLEAPEVLEKILEDFKCERPGLEEWAKRFVQNDFATLAIKVPRKFWGGFSFRKK